MTYESEESFAKQQLKSKESGTKLWGLGWNESEDTISIYDFQDGQEAYQERSIADFGLNIWFLRYSVTSDIDGKDYIQRYLWSTS